MNRFRWFDKYEYEYFKFIGERYLCWDANRLIPIERAVLLGFSLEDLVGIDVLLIPMALVSSNIQAALTCVMDETWGGSWGLEPDVIALDARLIKLKRS